MLISNFLKDYTMSVSEQSQGSNRGQVWLITCRTQKLPGMDVPTDLDLEFPKRLHHVCFWAITGFQQRTSMAYYLSNTETSRYGCSNRSWSRIFWKIARCLTSCVQSESSSTWFAHVKQRNFQITKKCINTDKKAERFVLMDMNAD